MKSAASPHQYEDKLLEFAYGELPKPEADAVEAHVLVCPRCSQALGEIQSVRSTMAQVPQYSAPEAGLESLLAYAEQAASRAGKTQSTASSWKRFLAPLASMMALVTVGVVAFRANEKFDTSPASVVAEGKLAEVAAKQEAQPQAPAAQVEMPPAMAAKPLEQAEGNKAGDDVDVPRGSGIAGLGSSTGSVRRPAPRDGLSDRTLDDFGNAGGGRAKESKKGTAPAGPAVATPPEPAAQPAPPQQASSSKTEQVPELAYGRAEPKAKKSEADKAPSRESFALRPMNAGSGTVESEEAPLEKTDALAADRDAAYSERQRTEQRTQSLQSARAASSRGDVQTEIKLLTWVLENGAAGYEKIEALQRLCTAYQVLGDVARADPYCDRLLTEFPNSVAARELSQSRAMQQRAAPKPASAPSKANPKMKSGY